MFHRPLNKSGAPQVKLLKDLTRIISPEHMLNDEKRTTLLRQIRDNVALEAERFDSLCLTTIHHLIYHCQHLPDSSNSYYSQPGGLLDYALNRTEIALNLFKQYIMIDDKSGISEEQKLWQYALLTAALLQGIGKLPIDYQVELYDGSGQFLKQWNPLLENLVSVGNYYNYSFQKEVSIDFRRRLNILLARFLMPASGFAWIASNPHVLATWLALLNEEPYAAGTLGAVLIRANALAIQRYLMQLQAKAAGLRAGRYGRVSTFTGGAAESISDVEQQIGVEFMQWMTKSLASGAIMVNQAPLLMVPGGMLMLPDMFKLFIRQNPEFKNWQAAQNGFLSLGLHQTAADGGVMSRFEQAGTQQIHTGVLFRDYAVALPADADVQLHNWHTGKIVAISATELIHLAQASPHFTQQQQPINPHALLKLNQAGGWQESNAAETIAPLLKHGIITGV